MFAGDWAIASRSLKHARMEPRVKSNQAFDMGGVEAARAHKAARELGHLRHVVITVCCYDKHASTWAKENDYPEDMGIQLLRFGLMTLHRFYIAD
jgi:hypothetical protein